MQSQALILPKRSLYHWNLMIRAATSDARYSSLAIYSSMINSSLHGNSHTYPLLFKSCAYPRLVHYTKQLHTHVVKLGFQPDDVFVQTSLIDAYPSCSCLEDARRVFDEMPKRSGVTWSCMITGYSRQGKCGESFLMLKEMMCFGFELQAAAVVGVLDGCNFLQGSSLHCCIVKAGLCCETELLNSVMGMYIRCGFSDGAWAVFNAMAEKSVVSWTIMIQGLANAGDFNGLCSVFRKMRLVENISSDANLFVSVISGCGKIGDLLLAAFVHGLILKAGLGNQRLLDKSVYTNCGDIVSSRAVFDAAVHKDVFLWTCMIGGYAQLFFFRFISGS